MSILSSPNSNIPLCDGLSDNTVHEDDTINDSDGSLSSTVMFPSDVHVYNPDDSADEVQPDSPLEGPLRVRFRPRVRITSGLNRHRHRRKRTSTDDNQNYFTFTPSSSFSGSASSSISAPLRSRLDDEVGKPGWGTLGQRVALFSKRQYPIKRQPEGGLRAKGDVIIDDERRPLLDPSFHFLLRRDLRYVYRDRNDEEDFSRLIDRVFGPWPARLLNYHVSIIQLVQTITLTVIFQWWHWQLERLTSCQCFNVCDDDGYS